MWSDVETTQVVRPISWYTLLLSVPWCQEKNITVSSDLYDITISTTGAAVRGITLKKFKETNLPDAKSFEFMPLSPQQMATFKTSGSEGLAVPADLPFQLL